jgi:hypothetical protein
MIGDLWRWGLQDEARQADLGKSWRQLVRWLVADVPARITVAVEPAAHGDPAEFRLTVTARDESFKPLDNATVRLTVRPISTAAVNPETFPNPVADTNYVQLTAESAATGQGTYEATYIARDPGAYSVEALVTRSDGNVAGQAVAGWTSDPAAAEFRSLKPNRSLLESMAKQTGGEVVRMEDLEKFVRQLPARHAPVTETWTNPLWQQPVVFLLVLGCFVAEWGIRRWKGLP